MEAYLYDLGKDGGEGYGEEESEHAGVQVPEGAAPDEGDQGHQDQGDDARVDDAFAYFRGGAGFSVGSPLTHREREEGGRTEGDSFVDGIGVLDRGVGQGELTFVACLVCQYADEDEQDDCEAATMCCDEVSGQDETRRRSAAPGCTVVAGKGEGQPA